MNLLVYLFISFIVLAAAYWLIGRWLRRAFQLSTQETTPAHQMRDGLDYEPIRASYLLPQHFSAIAAAGPIVGPILAGMYFGWGPTWLWILAGSILIGGIHDFTALLASVRHRARSVAEIVREYMNPRAYVLFLIFIWFSLLYVIIAFADVTAGAFVARGTASVGEAPGPAVATSSILYLMLAVVMGLSLRFTRLSPATAKFIFLPLVAIAILLGPHFPLDLAGIVPQAEAQRYWGYILLAYCFVAAVVPVWSLLQPRGALGGYFLYIVMIVGVGGIVIGSIAGDLTIGQPFMKGWTAQNAFGEPAPLLPILFITVACGACSGFHSIVASGTTSKQLRRETDAVPIGYGSMLLEGFFACISLATVMVLSEAAGSPDLIYAQGIARFGDGILGAVGLSTPALQELLLKFALLCFATFVFDTLDACTRLARYVLMEMLGWKSRAQAWAATALSLVLPAIAVSLPPAEYGGKPLALWRVFWGIFGSSNQMLAALTLLGVTVWLARRRLPWWIAFFPTVFMMAMTLWSLVVGIEPYLALLRSGGAIETIRHVQFGITVMLFALSLWLVVEALLVGYSMLRPPTAPVSLSRKPAATVS